MWFENIKTLPVNPAIEEAILSSMLIKNSLYFQSYLKSDDFSVWFYKSVFEAFEWIIKLWKGVDILSLVDKLWGYFDELVTIQTAVVTTQNFQEHCEIIKELANKRRLIVWLQSVFTKAYWEDKVTDLLWDVQKVVMKIDTNSDNNKLFTDVLVDTIDNMDKEDAILSPTYYHKLDWYVWWLKKWQLVIVAWRPWMWKTNFALNLIDNIAKKTKVMMFSLEMRNQEIIYRILSKKASIPYSKFDKKPDLETEAVILKAFQKIMSDEFQFVLNDKTTHIDHIVNEVRKQKIVNWLDVVFIDQLQVMKSSLPQTMKLNHYEYITQTLKLLAKELDIAIVLMCQLNREVTKNANNRPGLQNLRDSWSIEQDADVVMLCHREWYYDKDEKDDKFEVIVAKNRNWVTWSVDLWLRPSFMDIYDIN